MKAFARKQNNTISLVPTTSVKNSQLEVNSVSARHSFNSRVQTMPAASRPMFSFSRPAFRTLKLSIPEVTRVNHATIREGKSHRIWPPSVLQQFLTADVITDSKIEHYQVREGNLRKVS